MTGETYNRDHLAQIVLSQTAVRPYRSHTVPDFFTREQIRVTIYRFIGQRDGGDIHRFDKLSLERAVKAASLSDPPESPTAKELRAFVSERLAGGESYDGKGPLRRRELCALLEALARDYDGQWIDREIVPESDRGILGIFS